MSGKCVIISAPSGSGKTTLVKYLLSQEPSLRFSVSASSRVPRTDEVNGKDYHFLSPGEFRKRIADGDFIEWEEVYHDQYYGSLRSEVERIWDEGGHVIFDVDVKGGINLKKALGKDALSVFIKAPSVEAIERRLRSRGTESEESLNKRVSKAESEISDEIHFDRTVVNDDLKLAEIELLGLVKTFLKA